LNSAEQVTAHEPTSNCWRAVNPSPTMANLFFRQ
jgi:hypothetical protein